MKLTRRLLKLLNRVFDKDPQQFLALRLRYDGQMRWEISDATLTTSVVGGSGLPLSVDLRQFTVSQLVSHLAAQPGYRIEYATTGADAQLGARVLLDGSGDQDLSNGDHLTGYSSVLWAFLESFAAELREAAEQIAQMLRQMSIRTAEDVWLDELGDYYGVPRLAGESDGAYGPRLIAEVLRPRSNNVAIAQAIRSWTGQETSVSDVMEWIPEFPVHDASITYNGAFDHQSGARPVYALFDVVYGYDIENGGSIAEFQSAVEGVIERLRAAGTFLRSLNLSGSTLQDTGPTPTDDSAMPLAVAPVLTDALTAPQDTSLVLAQQFLGLADVADPGDDNGLTLTISAAVHHDGLRTHNGAVGYFGGVVVEAV